MKKLYLIVLLLATTACLSQQFFDDKYCNSEYMRVLTIEDHEVAYILVCINSKADTLKILTTKKEQKQPKDYVPIRVGTYYNFILSKPGQVDNLTIGTKGKVFWYSKTDRYKDYPHSAINVDGLFIKAN